MNPSRRLLVLASLAALGSMVQALQMAAAPAPLAKVQSKEITEMSGIVRSGRFKDTYWVHNDSGDTARLFAIRGDGKSIGSQGGISIRNATNIDWEDITREGDTLIVSDMGNNKNRRHNLGVYLVPEPDPKTAKEAPASTFIPIAYPDQTDFPPKGAYEFDCEALFSLRGKLYFITKHRINSFFPASTAKLYRLDTRDPLHTNVLTLVDRAELGGWVTSASVSPDGTRLAVLTHLPQQSVWLFDVGGKDDHFLSKSPARRILLKDMKQTEGICWDDNRTLRVTNEQGEIYRLSTRTTVKIR